MATISQMKEELNTFQMVPNIEIFIHEIVHFESQSPYYPIVPRTSHLFRLKLWGKGNVPQIILIQPYLCIAMRI